jgi:hypothetical protein
MRALTIALLCLMPVVVFGATGQYRLSWRSDPATACGRLRAVTAVER